MSERAARPPKGRIKARRRTNAFVFAVVGDKHVAAVNIALGYLKQFSRAEILVFQSRSGRRAAHDQVVVADLPDDLDDRRASIYLKTTLHRRVADFARCFCYLDSDVIAVNQEVDAIFAARTGPVNFAADHVEIDSFSRWAVNCGCTSGTCDHLRTAIAAKFGNVIDRGGWRLWNGGVFLFDDASVPFLERWHELTCSTFVDPYWKVRDQGALAAATWQFGLQEQPPLDGRFNFIVDRMWGIPSDRRDSATTAEFHHRRDYSLGGADDLLSPRLIHFVNGGVGQAGWRNWDEVAALRTVALRATRRATHESRGGR